MLKIKISAPHVHGSACGCEHMEEEQKPNPWAICTAQVGREDKEKYEDCVLGVKEKHGIKKEEKEVKISKEELKQIIKEELAQILEKWKGDPEIKQTGEWAGKTKEELCSRRDALKDKKERTAADSTELRQINFAIRSKQKGPKFGSVDC